MTETPKFFWLTTIKALKLAYGPPRVLQVCTSMRRRGYRLSALSAAACRVELIDRERLSRAPH